jgi:two-component system sensor kinase FixL
MNESSRANALETGNSPPCDSDPHRGHVTKSADQDAWVQAVLDAAVEGMILIDEQGTVLSMNPVAVSVFGYTAKEVLGNNINMLMASPYREAHDGYLRQYRETGQKHVIGTGREVVGRRKDGSEIPLELSVSEVNLGDRVFIGTLKDLSERHRAEKLARQHEAELAHIGRIDLLGEMATGIAHELNQPLAAIAAFASACKSTVLAEGIPSDNNPSDTIVDLLVQIDEQTHRAAEIIRRLRRLARKSQPHRSTASVNAMILDSISLIDGDARLRDVTIVTDLSEDLPSMVVDRVQIEQVLLNLLRNAVEAVEDSPQRVVTVVTRLIATPSDTQTAPMIEVEVRDTGTGLTADELPKVFEAFFTTKQQGMGMGLAICRSIIDAHDGKLSAAPGPDGGASFRFTLPAGERARIG